MNTVITERQRPVRAYVTFARGQRHEVNGHVFDLDKVAIVQGVDHQAAHRKARKLFGHEFHGIYEEAFFRKHSGMFEDLYPDGILPAMKLS